jgi:hypothetical protein
MQKGSYGVISDGGGGDDEEEKLGVTDKRLQSVSETK